MENRIPHLSSDENLQQLELPGVIRKLNELLVTPYGPEHLEALEILHDKELIENKLREVTEMVGIMEVGHSIPLGGLEEIRPLLDRLQPEDAFLEAEELNLVKNNLQIFQELNRFFQHHKETCQKLIQYVHRIHPHRAVIEEIEHRIDHHNEIKENASPELRRVRQEINSLENEQKSVLNKVVKRYSEFSQDDIVTLRDGRMVLGIQQHYVNRVNGVVHGTSGTGATVFIEPMETLRLSNKIQGLRIEERKEIIRLLQYLSGLIREIRNDIFYAIENVGTLDFIHSKSRLSMLMKATEPEISTTMKLSLHNARHPILLLKIGHQNVVPASLRLGEDFHTLVITGPNAGGKTVVLKTVGLLVIMAQLGLHIPAEEDSIIPLFDDVLVDIGDRQNLEQDLSTFSAHVIRLQQILRNANTHTLVLVDEIGTGTDPREGSALAIAFIKEMTEREALTIATTHHGELKAFAYSTNGVKNASMEFNLESLQPTYRLQVGIPGSSYAFEIARRYGLSETVLKNASEIVGPDKGEIENMILNLNEKLQEASKERRELSIKLSEMEGLKNLYQNEMDRLKREKNDLRRKAAEDAKKIVDEANARIENVIAEIRKTDAQKEKIRKAHEEVAALKKSTDTVLKETEPKFETAEKLHQGDVVWLNSLREEGELLSDPNSEGRAWTLVGNMRMQLDIRDMKKIAKKEIESPVVKQEQPSSESLKKGVMPELDLRGQDSYEAVEYADRYLDEALQQGWEEVRIIHGKGTGVLRQKINQFLDQDKRVADKRLGKWGEGDTGVTIVKLRK